MKNKKTKLVQTYGRKTKKRDFSKRFVTRINSYSHTSYGFYARFTQYQKLQVNRKVLASLLITEKGTSFGLWTWLAFFRQKFA
uniref:Ribosomal protein L20 n=1 Tax=Gloiopeltis furcata TaxID=42017 RepID=A0A5A4SGA7_9FLOR|nr:ribosomal protein L20 [Gloiopeltis furcata]BBK20793.1 ribosomal protein L20 [Gloiopeltis furcata]